MRRHPRGCRRSVDRGTNGLGIEPRKLDNSGMPTPYGEAEGNTTDDAKASRSIDPARSETPSTIGGFLPGNREIPCLASGDGSEVRAVKPTGVRRAMHEHGKSDSCVVPMKSANETSGAPLAEEQMEGRRLANSNSLIATATRLSPGMRLQLAVERVRQVTRPVRHDWRQEPSAVVPLAGIRAGGAG